MQAIIEATTKMISVKNTRHILQYLSECDLNVPYTAKKTTYL